MVLAVAGVVITVALAQMWWIVNTLDPLPAAYWFLLCVTFLLCPPELPMSFAAMDISARGQLVAWVVVAALNGVLYYGLGRGIVALRKRRRSAASGWPSVFSGESGMVHAPRHGTSIGP